MSQQRDSVHERPLCFQCQQPINLADAVFASPCGHPACASACFHGIHLMEWRERRGEMEARVRAWVEQHGQHGQHDR